MKPEIVSGNILLVDGEFLQVEQYDQLRTVLYTSPGFIFDAIESQFRKQKELNPDAEIKQSSVWLMRLAKSIGEVVTQEALERDSTSQENRGVFTRASDIQPGFRDYWFSVAQAGFHPEIREASTPKDMRGACLLAKMIEPRKLY